MHITYQIFSIKKKYAHNRYIIMHEIYIKMLLIVTHFMSRLMIMVFYAVYDLWLKKIFFLCKNI